MSTELEFVDMVVVDKFVEHGVVDMIMVDLGALVGQLALVEFRPFRLLADIFVVVMVTYFVVVSTDELVVGLFICSEIVLLST